MTQHLSEALLSVKLEREIVNGLNGLEVSDAWARSVVSFLQDFGGTGSATWLGSKKYDVTPEWAQFNPGKSPAKTDFTFGGMNISLKSSDRYQILNANKNESLALFTLVADEISLIKSRAYKLVLDCLQNFVLHAVSNTTIGKAKSTNDPLILTAQSYHSELSKQLELLFSNNPTFKERVIHEVLSGTLKFGTSSPARATHILSTTPSSEIVLSALSDKRFISRVSSNVILNVSFSSSASKGLGNTGKYRYWSVIRMIVDGLFEETNKQKLFYANGTLNEGAIDFIRKIVTHLKSMFEKSISNILDFLQLEPVLVIV